MEFSEISYECLDGVAKVTLNKPQALNPLGLNMAREISHALELAKYDETCRVIIVTGSGRAFSAGGDIKALQAGMNVIEGRNYVMEVSKAILAMQQLDKPIIAAVNGYAMGAGFNLALAADLILAVKEAKFGQIFLQVGLAVDAGGSYFLPRAIGPYRAKELLFTDHIIDAAEALKLGLINKVVEQGNLEEEVYSLARTIAEGPAQALGLTKRLVNSGLTNSLEHALADEANAQSICMQTYDHQEGLAAFMEKRPAKFTGV